MVRGATWFLRNSSSAGPTDVSFGYGRADDRPLVGDWDGNGTSTPGRLRDGQWLLRNSSTAGNAEIGFGYGVAGDLGQTSTSALTTPRGGKPLTAALTGIELTRLPTAAKVVALTFDAGSNADGLPAVTAALQAANVPATFFLTGQWVTDFPAQARTLGLRYPIGNHSFSHPDLTTLTDSQVRSQLSTAATAILAQTRYDQRPVFRFPFGARDRRTIGLVNGLGYTSVRWTVDTLGWEGTSGGQSAASVVARVLAGLTPGEIVLMHVGSHPTDGSTLDADALPTLIQQLRARGYGFVTVPSTL